MNAKKFNRRDFLRLSAVTAAGAALAACKAQTPEVVQQTVIVQGTPQVVTTTPQVVQQTVIVQGTPQVVTATPPPKVITLVVGAYYPTEWTERSADHPQVTNAPRILAEKYKDVEPNIEIKWLRYTSPEGTTDTYTAAWYDALAAAGNMPDVTALYHEIPILKGYAMPIEDYLKQPNPYAPEFETWYDSFYPSIMNALKYPNGHIYCAPVQDKITGFEVGMFVNMDWFKKIGMEPPKTWTEQKAVCKALKEAGSSVIPWPPESKEGNIWALGLQLLPSMLQPEAAKMDTNGDLFVGAPEALVAFRNGLVGPLTPKYKKGWQEQKLIVDYWPQGWASADLEALWRNGEVGMRQSGAWEVTAQMSDPQITFERKFIPPASVTSEDLSEANDPPEWTKGDGTVPEGALVMINGPDQGVSMATKERGTTDAAIKWLQWTTAPENDAFIVNENQELVPTVRTAPLGTVWKELLSYPMPKYKYAIAWWGECLQFDNTLFNETRKLFVAWATGQMDDATFFKRQQEETIAGANRYEAAVSTP